MIILFVLSIFICLHLKVYATELEIYANIRKHAYFLEDADETTNYERVTTLLTIDLTTLNDRSDYPERYIVSISHVFLC